MPPNKCYHKQRLFCVCERKIPYVLLLESLCIFAWCAVELCILSLPIRRLAFMWGKCPEFWIGCPLFPLGCLARKVSTIESALTFNKALVESVFFCSDVSSCLAWLAEGASESMVNERDNICIWGRSAQRLVHAEVCSTPSELLLCDTGKFNQGPILSNCSSSGDENNVST